MRGRTTRVVRQKMGHRCKHRRDGPYCFSPSPHHSCKYTDSSSSCGWTLTECGKRRRRGGKRGRRRRRENDITSPWRGRLPPHVCEKLWMPSCCQSANCKRSLFCGDYTFNSPLIFLSVLFVDVFSQLTGKKNLFLSTSSMDFVPIFFCSSSSNTWLIWDSQNVSAYQKNTATRSLKI